MPLIRFKVLYEEVAGKVDRALKNIDGNMSMGIDSTKFEFLNHQKKQSAKKTLKEESK